MKILFTIAIIAASSMLSHAQLFPEFFSYQAVVRDEEGNILANADLSVRLSIQWEFFGQLNDLYIETHQTTTNEYGLIDLTVGTGVPGNAAYATFDEIMWFWYGYSLKVEIDAGNGFVNLGQETMSAVPFSMYSKGNWGLYGNLDVDATDQFIGTINDQPLIFKTNNETKMELSTLGRLSVGHGNPQYTLDIHSSSINNCTIGLSHYTSDLDVQLKYTQSTFLIENYNENAQFYAQTGTGYLSIDNEGHMGINTEPSVPLHVADGSDLSLGNNSGGFLVMGNTSSSNMVLDQNEIVARNNGQAATLFLNTEAGAVVVNDNSTPPYDFYVFGLAAKPGGGSWASYSDANLKHDVKSFDLGLETLLEVNPVNFKYIPEFAPDAETEYVGIIAQDLQKIAPFMVQSAPTVFEDGHSEEYLSVDPSAFTYMLINSVKELKAEIDLLKSELQELKSAQTIEK